MHWARASVNPVLALRNGVCNDRWAEAWAASVAQMRRVGKVRRAVQSKVEAAPQPETQATDAALANASSPMAADQLCDQGAHGTDRRQRKKVTHIPNLDSP